MYTYNRRPHINFWWIALIAFLLLGGFGGIFRLILLIAFITMAVKVFSNMNGKKSGWGHHWSWSCEDKRDDDVVVIKSKRKNDDLDDDPFYRNEKPKRDDGIRIV